MNQVDRRTTVGMALSALQPNPVQRSAEEEMASEIFSTIDQDRSDEIEFSEFVLVLAVSRCVEMLRKQHGDDSIHDRVLASRVIAAKWENALEDARSEARTAKRTGKPLEQREALNNEVAKLKRLFVKSMSNLEALERTADRSSLVFGFVSWRIMDYILLATTIGQSLVLAIYGVDTGVDKQALLYICNCVSLLYGIEMMARIKASGSLKSYLNDSRRPWTPMANRAQFGLILCTSLGAVAFFFLDEDPQRVAMGIIASNLFRALILEQSSVKLLYSFSFGFDQLAAYAGLLWILYYTYSWFAFQMFEDKVNVEHRHFNSFGASMLTMWQVFIGEGWHSVMQDAVLPTTKINITFFLSYVLACRLFVADFMVSDICYYSTNFIADRDGHRHFPCSLCQE